MLVAQYENVTSHYGAQDVLNGVSFEIHSGQRFGLIGANGSGKTTILRILLGQGTPTGGHISLASGLKCKGRVDSGIAPKRFPFGDPYDPYIRLTPNSL